MGRYVLMLLSWFLLVVTVPGAAEDRFINIATGGTKGTYFPIGAAIARIYAENIGNIRVQVQSTEGSIENIQLVNQERAELALATGDSLSQAMRGEDKERYPQPLLKLQALGAVFPTYMHLVATKASGIRQLADLKGKRVSVGAKGSGTELNSKTVFNAAGISYQDFERTEFISFSESLNLLKNRQLDASQQTSGLGVASIRELTHAMDIVFVPIPAGVVAAIGDPAYASAVIPENTYSGQDMEIPTAVVWTILFTKEGLLDKDMGYRMAKALYENAGQMAAAHNAGKSVSLKNALNGVPLPLHPGAEQYFREKGLF